MMVDLFTSKTTALQERERKRERAEGRVHDERTGECERNVEKTWGRGREEHFAFSK